ncbi:MAG: hypothetical protein NTX27_07980 [Verrucomicrobia bacterium]|jgi:hypothetical protein|nr:hypothetical protein [Verrucomicrobiota bacterium]
MNLDPSQRSKVAEWIGQGMKLSEIQSRLASELDLRLTYMETRMLVDDLKLTPKDPEPAKPSILTQTAAEAAAAPIPEPEAEPAATELSVTVDQLTRPGSMVSGKVVFSDGQKAEWYLDQTGRLGLAPKTPGYRPGPLDVQKFQMALEAELGKLGL